MQDIIRLELTLPELRVIHATMVEALYGSAAIPEWECPVLLGVDKAGAGRVLDKVHAALDGHL